MTRIRTLVGALVEMSRPPQLALIAGVYALGAAVAVADGAGADAGAFSWGLAAVLVLAASVHYANEYADHETDRLTDPTPFSGGSQALPRTGLSRSVALRAGTAALATGGILTAAGLVRGHLSGPAAAVLVAIGVLGWQYSVGPLRLAWRGWGELTNAALGGLALPAYGYATIAGSIPPAAVLPFVPFFAVVFCNLLATTWPDREADGAVGKRTLATRWSTGRLRATYALAAVVAGGSLAALVLAGVVPVTVAATSLVAAPLLAWGFVGYTRRRTPFPTVAAMVSLAAAQLVGWALVAGVA